MADEKKIVIEIRGGVTGAGGTDGGGKSTPPRSSGSTPPVNAGATESLYQAQKRLNKEYKASVGLNGELSDKAKKLKAELEGVNDKVRRFNQFGKDSQNSWGKALTSYQFKFNALGNIMSNVVSTGVAMMARLGKSIITASKDFEFQMSGVKAITMATETEFRALSNDAIRLGGSTIYTSKQVAGLQEELAKLGFTVVEIRAATDGVLALAAATGEDLSQSALVAGTIIRGFGLSANDLTRVVDVMSQSFNNSALDLTKFAETMKYVAPIASKVGFTVEETTTLMSKLADQGVVASQAGTGLRNIMLRLADSNSKLSKAMGGTVRSLPELIYGLKQLKKEGIDATGALKLVDRYSVTAFLGLIGASDKLWESYEKLNDSYGIAQKMADIRMDNFAGSVEKLTGAWDSLVLTVNEGNSILRVAVDVIRALIEGVTKLFQSYDQAASIAANERLVAYRKTIDESIVLNNKGYTEYAKLLNAQLENELITRKEYGEQMEYIKIQQKKETNDITNDLLKDQLKAEQSSLPLLEKIMNDKNKILNDPYSSANEAQKMFALKEAERATANYDTQVNQINDITGLIDQNSLERVGLLNDYSNIESEVIADTEKKWKKLELVKIEAMEDGMMKEIALVQYGYKEQLEEAAHYGQSNVAIYENMVEDIRKVIQKFQKENSLIASQLNASSSQMQLDIFDSLMGKDWKTKMKDKATEIRDTGHAEWKKILDKVNKPEQEEDIKPTTFWEKYYDGQFDLTSEQKQALEKGFNFVTDEIQKLADKEVEMADRRVENSERVVEQLQSDLQIELQLAEQGFASNVSLKRKELAEAKKNQAAAIALQDEALRKQKKVESALQFINLLTAVSGIIKNTFTKLDPITATVVSVASTAALFGAWELYKGQAQGATAKYGDGGQVGGRKHSNGGTMIEAEQGEYVIKASSYSKHAELVQAINNDNLSQIDGILSKNLSVSLDDSGTARMLGRHFNAPKTTYHNGYRIEQSPSKRRVVKYA